MKLSRNKVILGVVAVLVLGAAFWYGGNAPGLQGWGTKSDNNKLADSTITDSQEENKDVVGNTLEEAEEAEEDKGKTVGEDEHLSSSEKIERAKKIAVESPSKIEKGSESYSEIQGMKINPDTGKDAYLTDPVPEGKPVPIEPQNSKITNIQKHCTLSVRCNTILNNIKWLNPDKVELVPEDGVIYKTKKVMFYEGESVFNLLLREMKKEKIHMEFTNTPIYNSAYIEGINNLYEFDCGELSGWMYKVNNWFPNYGASRYALKEGDKVEWVYTCDLGVDVGGFAATGGNQ